MLHITLLNSPIPFDEMAFIGVNEYMNTLLLQSLKFYQYIFMST